MSDTAPVPFDYVRTGQVIVLADGPELLVYSGSNDQGMWKAMGSDVYMGVGATESHVLAVDYSGELELYRAIDGHQQSRIATHCTPRRLEVAPGGESAILADDAIVLIRFGGEPQTVEVPGASCLAWSRDGTQLAVGSRDGTLRVLDAASGTPIHIAHLQGEITDLRWRHPNQWAVVTGASVQLYAPSADPEVGLQPVKTVSTEHPILRLAISEDGAVAAVQVRESLVYILELIGDKKVGEVEFQRPLGGLRFGPAHWLAFGFDDGDANRLDVLTGKMTRTQAHVGRAQNAWAMNVRVNHAQVRGVVVGIAAGTSPIAKHNVPKIPKKRKKWFKWVAIAVVLLFVGFLCCGMSGGLGLFILW
ncbi:MAG: hypothetical protein EA397_03555 [Deltaproteobacteria bacterium]|nr:MAG: hypothetical protein EA397_03555 [Deltaproteobacteria bacterium]